ncbi:MAG: disulfide isomerase DsbC N-terminal domain-containing protein, partial [Burkholderiales bacterium]
MKKLLITLMSAALLFGCNNQSSTNAKTPDQIKAELIKEIPGLTKIDAINKTPANGIYEVVVGRKVFYVTADGKYLLFGNLIDPVSKKSLTEQRSQELNKIDWNKLPLDLAIKEVNGSGQRKL